MSRDQRLLDCIPASLGPCTFVSQYSDSADFASNLTAAEALLTRYRDKARLIVTSMLHCALPAIAMGIPVVVLYPPNEGAARQSDRERFSSLADMIRVHEISEADRVDWSGACPDVGNIKLDLMDRFIALAQRWGPARAAPVAGWAPASALPVPARKAAPAPEDLLRLAEAKQESRLKWGARSSYRAEWAERGALAARFIADGEVILGIGAGIGAFRDLVAGRCQYSGADLQPTDPGFLKLDLETDALPSGPWDTIVMLGVLEYVHDPAAALSKVFSTAGKVVLSYCCVLDKAQTNARRPRGWVSDLDEATLANLAARAGFDVVASVLHNATADFEQKVFVLRKT